MLISAKNISFYINGKFILNKICHSFTEGKITGIIGPNGAGKSTLLKILCHIIDNFLGQILIDGQNIKNIPCKQLAKMISFLTQEHFAPSDFTVYDLVSFGRFPHQSLIQSSLSDEDIEAIDWSMQITDLKSLVNRKVNSLSGGERQRAWLAMNLAQRPKILLLDEPTTYLDIKHQLEVLNIISNINKTFNITVIMVLHDINQAKYFTDELIVLKDKKIFCTGPSKSIITPKLIKDVFDVDSDVFKNSAGDSVIMPIKKSADIFYPPIINY